VRNALSALNGPADTQGPYSLEMQYRVRNWGDGVFTLCVSPTLKSDDAHSVREYTREKKTHWKSKAVKHEVSESETVDKELSMFWGRNTIDVVIDVGNGDEGLPELVASALHGGVTLF